AIPKALASYQLVRGNAGDELIYAYDTKGERTGITSLLNDISKAGLKLRDMETRQSSLEDIFVDLVHTSEKTVTQGASS
ncbi:MAG: hypothetical protein WBC71_08085, partial [Salaquimonas sp.]